MVARFSTIVPLHFASDVGWHVLEYIFSGGSAILLGIAALLIISGRRDRRSFADESPDEARAEPLT